MVGGGSLARERAAPRKVYLVVDLSVNLLICDVFGSVNLRCEFEYVHLICEFVDDFVMFM
jgi:hypothetical protein